MKGCKMKKVFDFEESAKEFAKEVNGTVKQTVLPDYMSVDIIYVVEYDGVDRGCENG